MFTGLIEALGVVRDVQPTPGGRRLVVETALGADLRVGESVACSGACLTVVAHDAQSATFDIAPTTLEVTTIGDWRVGTAVNLERALRLGDRLGGHLVQGHVDATGRLVGVVRQDAFTRVTVEFPPAYARFLILRGSVAVDGISLTVASLGASSFDVQIVPHTWAVTTLSQAPTGTRVNLEFDMVAKYVLRASELTAGGSAPVPGL